MDRYIPFEIKKQKSETPDPAISAIPAIHEQKQEDEDAIPLLFDATLLLFERAEELNSSRVAENSKRIASITSCKNSGIAKIAGIADGSYPDFHGWGLSDLRAWKRCLECEWAWWASGGYVCLDQDEKRVDRAITTCKRKSE